LIATFKQRHDQIFFGTLFGAWLGGIYAFFSQAVNWIVLPGLPLAEPDGGLTRYLITNILLGAGLGLASSIPPATFAGVVSGGLVGAFVSAVASVSSQWGDETVLRTFILLVYTFLPLAVLLMPLVYMIRLGVDAQTVDPFNPQPRRRVLVPGILTLVAISLAAFSLYSSDVQHAFRYVDNMVKTGLQAASIEELPPSLRNVTGFRENAISEYELYWSENAEEFFGPRPATGEMSQFLIFTRFKNGYRIACVFSATTTVPNCTNQ
jgi:hypothetical protein